MARKTVENVLADDNGNRICEIIAVGGFSIEDDVDKEKDSSYQQKPRPS